MPFNRPGTGSMQENLPNPSAIRRGRFLWMGEPAQNEYLHALKEKISKGYFFSESIISQVAEDLAPVYVDSSWEKT